MTTKCIKTSSVVDDSDRLSEVLGVEDLAFQIASYLVPERNPSTLQEMMNNLIVVSRHWRKVFSLVRAQSRWDYSTHQLSMDAQWLYHKIVYIPGDCNVNSRPLPIPREGCLRIFRSHINEACKEAMNDYRSNRQNDEYENIQRIDSRPDNYYKAYQERPICIELVPPISLSWTGGCQFNIVNGISYDNKPRLISQYWATIEDVNGLKTSPGKEKSKEGRLDLGFHEISSVRESRNATLNPRPPLDGNGEDSTEFLRKCNAKAFDNPRWIRLAHLVGEDRCRMFVHKSLLPMIGPRPTGNTWHNAKWQN
ncbi:hypothetical protein ACHAWO_013676 [Cyclotella atomus]|uniref:F-box domain-containing protein n=1 Tax=Cyclotella atomus TaxID=382360 RepID=A0ABD3N001_9STRA